MGDGTGGYGTCGVNPDATRLVVPTVRLHGAWREAHAEWGPGPHEDGFGLRPGDDTTTAAGFAAWVARLAAAADPARAAVGRHRCSYRWIVGGGRVLGGTALRDGDDGYTAWAGHLGFGVRPSARRRGLAGWAVRRVLDEAWERGRDRVVAVCAVGNTASARTLERCGGVPEGVRDTPAGPVRRYAFAR